MLYYKSEIYFLDCVPFQRALFINLYIVVEAEIMSATDEW